MAWIEELFEVELNEASERACEELIPDVAAALDALVPILMERVDRPSMRRYAQFMDAAAQTLTSLPSRDPDALPPRQVVYDLLHRDLVELPWVAPTRDGRGVVMVLVDRLRGLAGGLPQQCVRPARDIDEASFGRFVKLLDTVDLERRSASPLRRAMEILELTSGEVADLMGVRRQTVDKWLLAGPPIERTAKIATLAEIADILRYRLRDGMPAVVARRPAEAYGNRSMLDLVTADEEGWLLESVRASFDVSRVA